jgi:thiamine-monophosphate kinase
MEREFHRWLKTQAVPASRSQHVLIGIGDDAALLSGPEEVLVVATDTIAEGTHFDLSVHALDLVGRKSLAVNLSDLAAMAAEPLSAVLSFFLPRTFGLEEAQLLYTGIAKLAEEFDVAIVGGDTNTWDSRLVVGVTVLGQRSIHRTGWTMDAAVSGDVIVVTGEFGGSIHGRHLSFTPRVDLARYLAANYAIHAATDVSDSLSLDLSSIGSASGVGFDLDLGAIPISSDVRETDFEAAIQHALADGEDFELIVTVPEIELERMMADQRVAKELTVIGKATEQHLELRGQFPDGRWLKVEPLGYEH